MARKSAGNRSCGLLLLFAVVAGIVGWGAYHSATRPRGILATLDYCATVIDLPSGSYRVVPALAKIDQQETFRDLIARLNPHAAITGTFYGPDMSPLGDVLIDGKLACRGFQRQGIGFTSTGKIRFVERHGSSRIDWADCRSGVACGPRLLRNGVMDIDVRRDGFRPAAAKLMATRCAVGATKDGKLVMIAIREPVTLDTLAKAIKQLGAVDAINMDGGALCGFYADGKCQAEPLRAPSNVIAVCRLK